jgi:hypothetical protein
VVFVRSRSRTDDDNETTSRAESMIVTNGRLERIWLQIRTRSSALMTATWDTDTSHKVARILFLWSCRRFSLSRRDVSRIITCNYPISNIIGLCLRDTGIEFCETDKMFPIRSNSAQAKWHAMFSLFLHRSSSNQGPCDGRATPNGRRTGRNEKWIKNCCRKTWEEPCRGNSVCCYYLLLS